jgi:phenylpropionate dioxygenase-like ring-hydroxylating dioxygenase large terminal subunit
VGDVIENAAALRDALERGATLPADWYWDPEILQLERERIFARTWQYAGPASVGDDERQGRVERLDPLVFVNPDADTPPLADTLDELPELIASSGLDLGSLRFRERVEWELPVNWKVAIENYLECYHCSVAHPSFSKLIDVDPDAYKLRAHGLCSSQFGPVRESARTGNGQVPYTPDGPVKQAQYHFVWPYTTINLEAGPQNLSVDISRPAGPERTVGFTDYFFAEDVSEETARAIIEFASQVGAEDAVLVESVQRGLRSGMIPHGQLLVSSEHLIQHFQRLVFDALTD